MKNLFNTFKFFFHKYPKETVFVVFLLFVSGLFEAIGIMAFFPFLQIFLDGKQTIDHFPIRIVDEFFATHQIPLTFGVMTGCIATAIAAKAVLLMVATYKVSDIVANIGNDFRTSYLGALMDVKWSFLTQHPLGESLNAIATENIRSAQTFVSITRMMAKTVQAAVYVISALVFSWTTCLAILAVGLMTALVLWVFVRMARIAGLRQTAVFKKMMANIADIINGLKPLRVMGLKKIYLSILDDNSSMLRQTHKEQLIATQYLGILQEPIMVGSAIAGIYISLHFGGLTGAELLLIMIFFVRIMTALNNVQGEYQKLVRDESAFFSLIDMIQNIKKETEQNAGTNPPPTEIKKISFENVSFSHENKLVFKDATIAFLRNELTLVSGASGTGKSTVLDLVSLLHRPDQGLIRVDDNEPLSDIDLNLWRKKIGFVPQDIVLFNDTVYNNIVMGRDHLTEKDVIRALKDANAYEFIEKLEHGIHSSVGECGRMLSGGQKQRIAIARAIVDYADILILDEVTSALDASSEASLLRIFKKLSKGRIVIMSSHSRAAHEYADKIYNIKNQHITRVEAE